jgi:hypothetical protein
MWAYLAVAARWLAIRYFLQFRCHSTPFLGKIQRLIVVMAPASIWPRALLKALNY